MFGSGPRLLDLALRTTLIISNEEMNDIVKILKSLEECGLLTKSVREIKKINQKNRKENF